MSTTMAVQLMLLMLAVSTTALHSVHSDNSSDNCLRDSQTVPFSADCNDTKGKKTIAIHSTNSGSELFIICAEENTLIDLTFHRLNVTGKYRNIKIENCTMKERVSFGDLFEHFGMKEKILKFEGVKIGASLDGRFSSGFDKVERLLLSGNEIQQLTADVFKSMPNLTYLDLSYNEILIMHESVFHNLPKLRTLRLNENKLRKKLPNGIFQHLKQLNTLWIHNNRLENVTASDFQGLDNLTNLDLSGNDYLHVPDDAFHNLPHLQFISMGNDGVSIPNNIFAKNSNLRTVRLDKVLIENGLRLNGVETLQITESDLKSLSGLSDITHISITNCELSLNATSFRNVSELITLNLSYNKLNDLDDKLFYGLTVLDCLQLSNNELTSISRYIFQDLHKLTEIDLSRNRIAWIDPNAFNNTKALKTVNLHHNQLSFSDGKWPFQHLKELGTLNLSYNNLTRMPSDLLTLKKLETVDLSSNQISSLKFSELRDYRNINFSSNALMVHSSPLNNYIYLNDNPLHCDCSAHEFLSKTDQKHLRNSFVQNCRGHAYHIKPCASQTISKCPQGCNCSIIESAKHLLMSCEGKGLKTVPEIDIDDVISIELNVRAKGLTELPKSESNTRVTFILASHNKITTIELENLPTNLRGLDVSHNRIRIIAGNVFDNLKSRLSLEMIFLIENPFECICRRDDSKKLIEFVQTNNSITDIQGQRVKCNAEYELSMEAFDKNCRMNAIIQILSAITAVVVLLGVMLILFYKHKQFIKVWLYAHSFCLWWVDEEYLDKDLDFDAFVAYSQKDCEFVHYLVNTLEKGKMGSTYKLFVHERDFLGGEEIEKGIRQGVTNSRRTLIILSKNFLESPWTTHEFHCAYERCVAEKRNRLIVVKFGDIGDTSKLDSIIRSYIETHTYIESNDKWFWEKIRYALPHKQVK